MSIERGPTPHTDAWLARLRTVLDASHGRRAALARHLAGGDERQLQSRKVQLSRVLNQGTHPEPEFVLATLKWLDANSKPPRKVGTKNTDGSRNA